MSRLNFLLFLLAPLCFLLALQACKNTVQQKNSNETDTSYQREIAQQIAKAKRLENDNNDSLPAIVKQLYQLNKLSGDKTALVYAELYEGIFYWQASDHHRSMQIAITTLGDANKLNVKKPLPQIYALIGNLNKETRNYDMAFKAADNGVKVATENKDTASIIALLGLKAMFTRGLSLSKHQPTLNDHSIDVNLQALKMAESSPKYERLRIRFYNNIGQYYKDQRAFDKTYFYVGKAVELAKKYHQRRSLTYSYCWLGEANYYQGNKAKGIALLDSALLIAKELNEPFRVMEINESFYDCYLSSEDYKEAIRYYTRAWTMRDSLKVLDNVKEISDLQLKYQTAEKNKNIARLQAASEIQTLQRNVIAVVFFFLLVIAVLFYIKEEKDKKLLQLGKRVVDEELRLAALELNHFTESLNKKNEVIEEFKSEIEQLRGQHSNSEDVERLENVVKIHIMTDESWENFRKLFTKVHPNFFDALVQKFPNLTANDTRMLSLVKLKLSNYEMSNMLGVTIEGVKKAKQRLRKKLGIAKEENLEDVISGL